jgi:D-3-phosphoglycerate dehydrogenase
MDVAPSTPYLLFVDNQDQPGTIGAVGTVAGRRNINISFMEVGRIAPRGQAMMVLGVDDPISAEALAEIMALPQIDNARVVAM